MCSEVRENRLVKITILGFQIRVIHVCLLDVMKKIQKCNQGGVCLKER